MFHQKNNKTNKLENILYIVAHRISLDSPELKTYMVPDNRLRAFHIVYTFVDCEILKPITGGSIPYHVLLKPDGSVEQIMPLSEKGAHARGYNNKSIGLAVVGHLDDRMATPEQFAQFGNVVASIRVLVPQPLKLVDHDWTLEQIGEQPKGCIGKHGKDLLHYLGEPTIRFEL